MNEDVRRPGFRTPRIHRRGAFLTARPSQPPPSYVDFVLTLTDRREAVTSREHLEAMKTVGRPRRPPPSPRPGTPSGVLDAPRWGPGPVMAVASCACALRPGTHTPATSAAASTTPILFVIISLALRL